MMWRCSSSFVATGALISAALCLESDASQDDCLSFLYASYVLINYMSSATVSKAGQRYANTSGANLADDILTIFAGGIQAARRGATASIQISTAASEHWFGNLRCGRGMGSFVSLADAHRFSRMQELLTQSHLFDYGGNRKRGGVTESMPIELWGAVTARELASIMRRGTDLATFLLRKSGECHFDKGVRHLLPYQCNVLPGHHPPIVDAWLECMDSARHHDVRTPANNGAGRAPAMQAAAADK